MVSPLYPRSVQKSAPTDSRASSASYRALYASPTFSLANPYGFFVLSIMGSFRLMHPCVPEQPAGGMAAAHVRSPRR